MKIKVDYVAQLKDAAGCSNESIQVTDGTTVQDLVRTIAKAHGGRLAEVLLDETGALRGSALLFVGDDQVEWDKACPLRDGVTITLMSPLAGG
jgi:molybdopterin converting factor small subunit